MSCIVQSTYYSKLNQSISNLANDIKYFFILLTLLLFYVILPVRKVLLSIQLTDAPFMFRTTAFDTPIFEPDMVRTAESTPITNTTPILVTFSITLMSYVEILDTRTAIPFSKTYTIFRPVTSFVSKDVVSSFSSFPDTTHTFVRTSLAFRPTITTLKPSLVIGTSQTSSTVLSRTTPFSLYYLLLLF